MKHQPRIAVIGSANIDLVTYTDQFPRPGETIFGREFSLGFGGKGANQAVAARLCGAEVAMVARVGDDLFGPANIENFASRGIDTSRVLVTTRSVERRGADFRGEFGPESDLGGQRRERPALARRRGCGGRGSGGRRLPGAAARSAARDGLLRAALSRGNTAFARSSIRRPDRRSIWRRWRMPTT